MTGTDGKWAKFPYGSDGSGHWTITDGTTRFDVHPSYDGSGKKNKYPDGVIVSPKRADAYAEEILAALNGFAEAQTDVGFVELWLDQLNVPRKAENGAGEMMVLTLEDRLVTYARRNKRQLAEAREQADCLADQLAGAQQMAKLALEFHCIGLCPTEIKVVLRRIAGADREEGK